MSLFDIGPVVSGYVSTIMDTWLQLASPTPDLWPPRHWCPEFLRPARTQSCLKFHGFASPKMPQFLGWFWWPNLTTTMLRLGRAAFGCLWFKGCVHCLVVRTHLLHTHTLVSLAHGAQWLAWGDVFLWRPGVHTNRCNGIFDLNPVSSFILLSKYFQTTWEQRRIFCTLN